jgi:hypothetical protein
VLIGAVHQHGVFRMLGIDAARQTERHHSTATNTTTAPSTAAIHTA